MLFINVAALFAIVIAVCGGIPHPQVNTNEAGLNIEHVDNSQGIPHWLGSAVSSLKKIIQDDTPVKEDNGGHLGTTQTSDLSKVEEDDALPVLIHKDDALPVLIHKDDALPVLIHKDDALPVLIHKEDELSGIKVPSITDADKTNPFTRTKRSTCATPTNLPQLVRDLNSYLNVDQFLGLNPQTPARNPIPANQPSTCPEATNSWWPKPEVNLRSTCPWNITEVDLNENAFPRYINKATCLCNNCIGSPTMGCEEINRTVFYLYRQGCQDGLAIMETRNITITVGCHCVVSTPYS